MAFPWNRSNAPKIPTSGRRRPRDRRSQLTETRRQSAQAAQIRDRQRLIIAVGGLLISVIIGIIAFGYYQEFHRPPRVTAGEVNDVRFSMGDLVKRIRVLQGLTGNVDLSIVPFEFLQDMVDAEILRQQGPLLGIAATEESIDQLIHNQFYPTPAVGQETDPGQLEREFDERYRQFLTTTRLSTEDYRIIVEEQIALQNLGVSLGLGIENIQKQVEIEWINIGLDSGIDPVDVRQRLESEDFASVVADSRDITDQYADPRGYVGWVPQGAFPDFDELLYGSEEKGIEPLAVGSFSDPTFSQNEGNGIFIIHKLSDPEERELSDTMKIKLNVELVEKWQQAQQTRGFNAGWLTINFNSQVYDWVADQVIITAPRVQETQ
jgi:hypothetical protein